MTTVVRVTAVQVAAARLKMARAVSAGSPVCDAVRAIAQARRRGFELGEDWGHRRTG